MIRPPSRRNYDLFFIALPTTKRVVLSRNTCQSACLKALSRILELIVMNVSPTLLSWPLIPLGLIWLASAAVHYPHFRGGAFGTTPSVWLTIFNVGGLVIAALAGTLISIRRRERSRFKLIDRIALIISCVCVVVFIITVILLFLKSREIRG